MVWKNSGEEITSRNHINAQRGHINRIALSYKDESLIKSRSKRGRQACALLAEAELMSSAVRGETSRVTRGWHAFLCVSLKKQSSSVVWAGQVRRSLWLTDECSVWSGLRGKIVTKRESRCGWRRLPPAAAPLTGPHRAFGRQSSSSVRLHENVCTLGRATSPLKQTLGRAVKVGHCSSPSQKTSHVLWICVVQSPPVTGRCGGRAAQALSSRVTLSAANFT